MLGEKDSEVFYSKGTVQGYIETVRDTRQSRMDDTDSGGEFSGTTGTKTNTCYTPELINYTDDVSIRHNKRYSSYSHSNINKSKNINNKYLYYGHSIKH